MPTIATVEISSLAPEVRKEHLRLMFAVFGPIEDIELKKRSKNSALIKFKKYEDAKECVHCFHHGLVANRKVFLRLLPQKRTLKTKLDGRDRNRRSRSPYRSRKGRKNRSLSVSSIDSYYSYYSYYTYTSNYAGDRRQIARPKSKRR